MTSLLERVELSRAALEQGDLARVEELARESGLDDPRSATAGLPAEELERLRRAVAALLEVAEQKQNALGAALGAVATARKAAASYGPPPPR